ncbi:MAG: hypothetical protein JKX91_06480 [Rhizobiaceae bacterium]|nr:hypothetical protein [Rhizobiaceae bacterium]
MAISYPEVRSEQIPAADTTHFTVEVGTTAEITQGTICNESTSAQTFSFHIPNPTAAAGVTNVVIDTKTILAGQTDLLAELLGKRFSAGTVFKTTASDGSSLNMHLSLMVRTI